MHRIYLNKANINNNDIHNVKKSLKSSWVATYGKYITKSELLIKKITNARYVCLLNSGTSALHLAIENYNFTKKSEVIVPSLTFISPVNSIIYSGLTPVFIDVGLNHNINKDLLLEFLEKNTYIKKNKTFNKKTNKQIVALIAVHMWGNIIDLIDIKKICKKYNLKLIEDAAEALGSYIDFKKKKIHAGTFGDIGCLSFNGNKIVTGGNGGAIITNDYKIYENINHLASQAKKDKIAFVHDDIGYNYKISNLNASLLYSQLKRLNFFLRKKKFIRNFYAKGFKNSKIFELLEDKNYLNNNNWLNILKINSLKVKPRNLNVLLEKKNIETRMVWHPNHDQTMFKKYQKFKIIQSSKIPKQYLCLPSGTNLNQKDLKKIISSLIKYEKKI